MGGTEFTETLNGDKIHDPLAKEQRLRTNQTSFP